MSGKESAGLYASGVLVLNRYLEDVEDPGLLDHARRFLQRARDLDPDQAFYHAVLGYTYDLQDRTAEALACFRQAHGLSAGERTIEVFLLTLLAESGDEESALRGIEAAASHHGVDLGALRTELRAAGFPTDARTLLANGFLSARNFFESWLGEERERLRNAVEPGRTERLQQESWNECVERQEELKQRFRVGRVPESLQRLAGWAMRVGVGDDPCRDMLLSGLSREERTQLIEAVDRSAGAIHAWLDSYGQGEMPIEAEAFLYLALAVEEVRLGKLGTT